MTMLMDMNARILHAIAIHTPFPLPEIEAVHDRLDSYDATIAATSIACEQNLPLHKAVDFFQAEVGRSIT